jgi:hypothetical protein
MYIQYYLYKETQITLVTIYLLLCNAYLICSRFFSMCELVCVCRKRIYLGYRRGKIIVFFDKIMSVWFGSKSCVCVCWQLISNNELHAAATITTGS